LSQVWKIIFVPSVTSNDLFLAQSYVVAATIFICKQKYLRAFINKMKLTKVALAELTILVL
jgi:hypothetical protein